MESGEMIMAKTRHDDGDKGDQNRKETLVFILVSAGGACGYAVAAAKGWTANSAIGDMIGFCAAAIGVCAGVLVYALCLLFLRR